jgi:bifunctional DNA-binding transcriptional regulator/antitoxin component of YhaV-PrlF toxin-antitoxin module
MKVTVPLQKEGRVAIPRPVREELSIDHGDLVEIEIRLPTAEA